MHAEKSMSSLYVRKRKMLGMDLCRRGS